MGMFSDLLVRTATPSLNLAEALLKDIKPEQFASKPVFGSTVVDTNHPAFIYGHLTLYPAKWLQAAGLDPTPAAAPPAYAELFSNGKECHHDPDRKIYPPMAEITQHFLTTHRAALEALRNAGDDLLTAPNPAEGRLREMFPTAAGLLLFYTCSHVMMHLGQVSAWRRCVGLGRVF